jgi:hypothetical protein
MADKPHDSREERVNAILAAYLAWSPPAATTA